MINYNSILKLKTLYILVLFLKKIKPKPYQKKKQIINPKPIWKHQKTNPNKNMILFGLFIRFNPNSAHPPLKLQTYKII